MRGKWLWSLILLGTLALLGNSRALAYTVTSPVKGEYIIVSNESVDESVNQSSGTLDLKSQVPSLLKSLPRGARRLDVIRPYISLAYRTKAVGTNVSCLLSLNSNLGDSKTFWVYNFSTEKDSQINATLKYSTQNINVWVNNNQITSADAKRLGDEFEGKIETTIITNFGAAPDLIGDNKINILCYNIQDDYESSGGYIGGYFDPRDLIPSNQDPNEATPTNYMKLLYIDTYPSMGDSSIKDVSTAYGTMAHEFEHMINYGQNVTAKGGSPMSVWLDEGLAEAAEQVYTGHANQERIDYFNQSDDIKNGLSLLDWENSPDLLANYSLSYLFAEYIKYQANKGDTIYKEIIDSTYNDYRAVEEVMKHYSNPNVTFGKIMTNFRGALALHDTSGIYSFNGDPEFKTIMPKPFSGRSINLLGGGAIVLKRDKNTFYPVPTNKGKNIVYTGIYSGEDITGPSISITPNMTRVTNQNIIITVRAFDAQNGIQYMILPDGKTKVTKSVLTFDALKNGTYTFSAVDGVGNTTQLKYTVNNIDKIAPKKPVVNTLTHHSTYISGKGEKGNSVYVVIKGRTYAGKISNQGIFRLKIPIQKKSTKVFIFLKDLAGNKSLTTTKYVL